MFKHEHIFRFICDSIENEWMVCMCRAFEPTLKAIKSNIFLPKIQPNWIIVVNGNSSQQPLHEYKERREKQFYETTHRLRTFECLSVVCTNLIPSIYYTILNRKIALCSHSVSSKIQQKWGSRFSIENKMFTLYVRQFDAKNILSRFLYTHGLWVCERICFFLPLSLVLKWIFELGKCVPGEKPRWIRTKINNNYLIKKVDNFVCLFGRSTQSNARNSYTYLFFSFIWLIFVWWIWLCLNHYHFLLNFVYSLFRQFDDFIENRIWQANGVQIPINSYGFYFAFGI